MSIKITARRATTTTWKESKDFTVNESTFLNKLSKDSSHQTYGKLPLVMLFSSNFSPLLLFSLFKFRVLWEINSVDMNIQIVMLSSASCFPSRETKGWVEYASGLKISRNTRIIIW